MSWLQQHQLEGCQSSSDYKSKSKELKFSFKNHPTGLTQFHTMGNVQKQQSDNLGGIVLQDIKAVMDTAVLKTRRAYSKQYIPLGSIVDNSYIHQNQLRKLHFQHIYLNSNNQNSLQKVIFKHNSATKQVRFYIPTFLRFSLIKLHSEDLKEITHIENKNNMIIYINVYTKGLPKMLIDRLTRKNKHAEKNQEAKLMFRANRHLFQAKYYTCYNDYLIFMFDPFSDNTIQFEIMKSIVYAPFQEAELILHIRVNKKIFKLQRPKTLKISKSTQSFKELDLQEQEEGGQGWSEQGADGVYSQEQHEILQFNKIILEFKLQKPREVTDSFKFHKSIQLGNYGIMTNQIQIDLGIYQSPQKKRQLQEQQGQLALDLQELHEVQLQEISSLRLSIGLYKHPLTEICTFFIPMMLAGGLTILLFYLCDHDLSNQLEVLAMILVAYGAFIPEIREKISMSRTVIYLDFYIVYNMIPAILCALQSINESRMQKTYNSYHLISWFLYYVSGVVLIEIYALFFYIETIHLRKYAKQMVHNFDTQIFQSKNFDQDHQQCLSWFVLKDKDQRVYFCQKEESVQGKEKVRKGFRQSTIFNSLIRQSNKLATPQKDQEIRSSIALEIKMSSTTNKTLREAKQTQDYQTLHPGDKQMMYRTKVIENQRHIHSFEKLLSLKRVCVGIFIIFFTLSISICLNWENIYEIYTFQDTNRNCVHDGLQDQELDHLQQTMEKQKKLQQLIQQNWKNGPQKTQPKSSQYINHHKFKKNGPPKTQKQREDLQLFQLEKRAHEQFKEKTIKKSHFRRHLSG